MILSLLLSVLAAVTPCRDSHDVYAYGSWGPFSKEYSGVSHISDINSGCRVDFTLVPGFYRRTAHVPNELFEDENGCYPWNFSSDFHSWTYRHELEWKDRVFVDATYSVIDESRVLLQMHCVNNTDSPQNLLLHDILSIKHSEDYPIVSADCELLKGIDYTSYEPSVRRHNYSLVYDGWMRGEKRDCRSLTGSVLETSGDAGDAIVYTLPSNYPDTVCLRWKATDGESVSLLIDGRELKFDGSGKYEMFKVPVSSPVLQMKTLSSGKFTIDAILLSPYPSVTDSPLRFIPEIEEHDGWFIVKYEDDPSYYGIAWNFPMTDVNQYVDGNLDVFIRRKVHDHTHNFFLGDGKAHYTSAFQRPVCVLPNRDTIINNLIACGTKEYVEQVLSSFKNSESNIASAAFSTLEPSADDKYLPGAEKYSLGYQIIRANLLNNIVYPVWTQGQYIRHFTPGKNWNSLYTWDSGFICWAMSMLNPEVAQNIVYQYTTDCSSQSAYIHHGTPLPIHFFAFNDFLNHCDSQRSLDIFYPRLKRFFDFMVGNSPGSTTRMPSGLLRTWDYFYNSGGWDDYPPQHALTKSKELYPHVTPMVQTSFYIRAAKIMREYARVQGIKNDVKYYDNIISEMSSSIQKYAWDPECGYFSYVLHDDNGQPSGFFRYKDGSNFNMGLDGVSPIVAGICTDSQVNSLLEKIFNTKRLWSDVGISTVDRSASYYSIEGYWNGCVWMPHQFILWKTMLDLGRSDLAEKIAYTALDTWEREVETTYRSFEHFMISSGRGMGWHNFSGLSSPVINWFSSYYQSGNVSCGFDVFLSSVNFSESCDSFSANVNFDTDCAGQTKTVIVTMNPDTGYCATFDGKIIPVECPRPGLLYVNLPVPDRVPKKSAMKLSIFPCKP